MKTIATKTPRHQDSPSFFYNQPLRVPLCLRAFVAIFISTMNALQNNTRQISAVNPTGPHSPGWIAALHCYPSLPPRRAGSFCFFSPACRTAFHLRFIFFLTFIERLQQNGKLNQVFSSLVKPPTFLGLAAKNAKTREEKKMATKTPRHQDSPKVLLTFLPSYLPNFHLFPSCLGALVAIFKGDYHE